jgi:uncharacterized protein YjbI with pentapeptide repeats
MQCSFEQCNFSLVSFNTTALREVRFVNCKLTGADFSHVHPFLLDLGFDHCQLNYASFNRLKLKETHFEHCEMEEADFTETDLSKSIFDNCNLNRALFFKTNLEKADFRTASNYSFDPDENRIKGAKFSYPAVLGLMAKYQINID